VRNTLSAESETWARVGCKEAGLLALDGVEKSQSILHAVDSARPGCTAVPKCRQSSTEEDLG
jgi:hypothetical protein